MYVGQRKLLCLAVFVVLFQANAHAEDQLTVSDRESLTMHLDIIASDPGWPQASVDAANGIVSNPMYSAIAWSGFFGDYFAANPFTDRLSFYLQHPTFYWFDESVHTNLQTGLQGPLMEQNIVPDWNTAINSGGSSFAANPNLRQDVFNSQDMLTRISLSGVAGPGVRQSVFDDFTALIRQYPNVLKNSVTLNPATQPYFGILRAQASLTLLAAAPSSDPSRAALSQAVKTQIASTLDLQGDYAGLWNDFTLLYLDNNLSSAAQLDTIHNYLGSIPPELHNMASITVDEFLGNTTTHQSQGLHPTRPYGGVNIFGLDVGFISGNEFPPDAPPGLTDIFSIVLAHEVNHVVDAFAVAGSPVLANRRQSLLSAAGHDAHNYLRSMFDNDFFQVFPQEFIASIANEWFADSSKTVELGLARFDAGRPQPLNQALFFAEIYSLGGDVTWFFEIDTSGNVTRRSVPLQRDGEGRINGLSVNNLRYFFELDSDGNVIGYSIVEVSIPGDFNRNGTVDAADYVVWRNMSGQTGAGLVADGNSDGIVNQADYDVSARPLWRNDRYKCRDINCAGTGLVGANDGRRLIAHTWPPRLTRRYELPARAAAAPNCRFDGMLTLAILCCGSCEYQCRPSKHSALLQ